MADIQRAAIVTGAGNGLGAAFAEALADAGTAVLVNNRRHPDRPDSAQAVAEAILARGRAAVADGQAVDAAGAAQAIVDHALAEFGRLDVLVLNAGISGPAVKVGEGDTALDEVMAINFRSAVELAEAALPALRQSPSGRIVFVASTGGLHGVRGRAAYAASKGAMIGWALSLADELRRTPIRVNILTPYAATKMTARADRPADPRTDPKSTGPVLAWLCSPEIDRSGEIWVAGAGHMRAARAMESETAPIDPAALDKIAERLAAMPRPRFYPGGEAAFADFYAQILESES